MLGGADECAHQVLGLVHGAEHAKANGAPATGGKDDKDAKETKDAKAKEGGHGGR